jgi:hypothetical protein
LRQQTEDGAAKSGATSAQAFVAFVAALPPEERQRLLNALTAGNASTAPATPAPRKGVNREGTK